MNDRNRVKRTVEPVLDDIDDGDGNSSAAPETDESEQPVESVLSEIAKDEIDEVGRSNTSGKQFVSQTPSARLKCCFPAQGGYNYGGHQ